jgi:hypothetical protein
MVVRPSSMETGSERSNNIEIGTSALGDTWPLGAVASLGRNGVAAGDAAAGAAAEAAGAAAGVAAGAGAAGGGAAGRGGG